MDWRFSSFILFLLALLFGVPWITSDSGLCGLAVAQKAITGSEAATCFEFWFNRYQTLLSAIVAAAAAAVAWVAVQKQIRATERQIAIGLGEIDPDFYMYGGPISPDTGISSIVIEIKNNNRLDMSINFIEIMEPDWLMVTGVSARTDDISRAVQFTGNREKIFMEVPIRGTWPSASQASRATLILHAVAQGRVRHESAMIDFRLIRIRITYFMRDQERESRSVELNGGIAFALIRA